MKAKTLVRAGTIALAALLLTCAHPARLQPDSVRPVWPAGPAAAQVRWVTGFPNPQMPGIPSASFWARAFDFVVGEDEASAHPGPLFARPFGMAADGDYLFVADPDARQVMRVRWRTGDVVPVVCPERSWIMPMAVAVASDGAMWVADGGAVVRRETRGRCQVFGQGVMTRPTGIAMARGQIFVVDPPAQGIWQLSPEGRVLGRLGARGTGAGQFNYPTGIAAFSDGNLLVVDALNFRLVELASDGKVVSSFGEAGDGSGAFGRPKAVVIDEAGRIYVSDAKNDVILIYRRDGSFDLAIGGSGSGPGQLTLPAGLAISDGFLFVADSYNHRIGIFEFLGGGR